MSEHWQFISTAMGGLVSILLGVQIYRQGRMEDRVEKKFTDFGESVDGTLDEICSDIKSVESKIEGNKEKLIEIFQRGSIETKEYFNTICRERQAHCADVTRKDVERNTQDISCLRMARKEAWEKHLHEYHPR